MDTPGFTPLMTEPAKKNALWMGLGLVVLAALVGLGIYYLVMKDKGKSKKHRRKRNGKNMRAKSAGGHMATKPQGEFQPPVKNAKQQYAHDRRNTQKSESLQASFAQRLSNINDLGLEATGCAADQYALGPDGGKGQSVDIVSLLPASWREPKYRPAEDPHDHMDTNWAAAAPTAEGFKTFIRASSAAANSGFLDSVLLPAGRIDALNRPRNPPMATSGVAHLFNDSSVRQDILADHLGDLEGVGDKLCAHGRQH